MRKAIWTFPLVALFWIAADAHATKVSFEGLFWQTEPGLYTDLPVGERITGSYTVGDELLYEYNDDSVSFSSKPVIGFELSGRSGWWVRANQGIASATRPVTHIPPLHGALAVRHTIEIGDVVMGARHIFVPLELPPGEIEINGEGTSDNNEGVGVFGPPPPGQNTNPTQLEILLAPRLSDIETQAPVVPEPIFEMIFSGSSLDASCPTLDGATLHWEGAGGSQRTAYFLINSIWSLPEPASITTVALAFLIAATLRRRPY